MNDKEREFTQELKKLMEKYNVYIYEADLYDKIFYMLDRKYNNKRK